MSDEEDHPYEIDAQAGDVQLTVSGPDEEWVDKEFDEKLERLEELSDMSDHHHVEAGAGWLMANASAESPEEAMAIWLDMWERMLEDVEELSGKEREQAGLARQ